MLWRFLVEFYSCIENRSCSLFKKHWVHWAPSWTEKYRLMSLIFIMTYSRNVNRASITWLAWDNFTRPETGSFLYILNWMTFLSRRGKFKAYWFRTGLEYFIYFRAIMGHCNRTNIECRVYNDTSQGTFYIWLRLSFPLFFNRTYRKFKYVNDRLISTTRDSSRC